MTRLELATGHRAEIHEFALSQDCALCHPRQWSELRGSMHSVAHEDPLYRSFALLARAEAGEEVYTNCSGCHSPAGVVTRLIPARPDPQLPDAAKAGVTCDVCHQVASLTGSTGPWGEPGNASFVLQPGRAKFGPTGQVSENPAHTGVRSDDLTKSEFCASCHTIIHPLNGLRIEHTFDEWKNSVYAEKGIQCQDCHMRTAVDAARVAREMVPVEVLGRSVPDGPERAISPHLFVGGNVDARRLGGGGRHAAEAVRRLQSAATLELEPVSSPATGSELELRITVTNIGAGHDLPTSLTELRQMWIHVRVLDSGGQLVFESGALDAAGEIPSGALRFGAGLVDAAGAETFKPWEAVAFGWKRCVPPKGSIVDNLSVELAAGVTGPLRAKARLLYRIAPPHVLHEIMGEEAFVPEIVEMVSASTRIELAR